MRQVDAPQWSHLDQFSEPDRNYHDVLKAAPDFAQWPSRFKVKELADQTPGIRSGGYHTCTNKPEFSHNLRIFVLQR